MERELERRELIGLAVVGSHAHQLVYGLVAFVTLVLGWRLLRAHASEGRTTT